MARQKVQLAFITDAAKRKAAFRKRKKSLMKKMEELTTLCGVQACAILHGSEFEPEPEFWPSKLDVKSTVAEFKSMPLHEQTRKMINQKSFTQQRIAKVDEKLKKQIRANRCKELTGVMYDCLTNKLGLENFMKEDLDDLGWLIDQKVEEIEQRIEFLQVNDPSQVGASTSNAAAAAAAAAGSMQHGGGEE